MGGTSYSRWSLDDPSMDRLITEMFDGSMMTARGCSDRSETGGFVLVNDKTLRDVFDLGGRELGLSDPWHGIFLSKYSVRAKPLSGNV